MLWVTPVELPPILFFLFLVRPLLYDLPYESIYHGQGSQKKEDLIEMTYQVGQPRGFSLEVLMPFDFKIIQRN